MSHNINAEIIAIGTELLLGEITDTNSVFIARALRDIGVNVYYMISVGDNLQRIAGVIKQSLERADVVITCGGLGPTVDDMTRQAVADATDRPLVFDENLLRQIAERFASFRVNMTENNRRQAYLPAGGTVVENPVGTAPSFIVEHQGKIVISLPGVPREMKFLMTERVVPYLQDKYRLGIIKTRLLKTAGIGESALDDMIGDSLLELTNPTVGLAAHHGQVDIRLTAKAGNETEANEMLDELEIRVRTTVDRFVYGIDSDRLEDVLSKSLEEIHASITIIEAGISDVMSDVLRKAAADKSILLSVQTFAHPDMLRDTFKLSSSSLRDIAIEVSERMRADSGSTVGLVILSMPDVSESADSTQASAAAVSVEGETRSRAYGFGAESDLARNWIMNWSMSSIWQMLKNRDIES